MAKSKQAIINQIKLHMFFSGADYRNWYCGISYDACKRLFDEHKVKELEDWWICDSTNSSKIARAIEVYFISLGTDGGSGGGDEKATMIYAYKKARHTIP